MKILKKACYWPVGVAMTLQIDQRLEKIEDLPTIPHTLQKVLSSLDEVSTSARTLEEIIRTDPILAAKVLRLANSPLYGASGEVNSIDRAVVLLGFEEVKNLVIGLSLTSSFSGDLGVEGLEARALWIHAIGVGTAAKMLGSRVDGVDPEELFTAGLIHDIGRFVMCLHFPEETKELIEICKKRNCPLAKAELEYGLSHSEIGAYLATRWGLSEQIISIARYHHFPKSAGSDARLAYIVFLADMLCHKLQLGWGDIGQSKNEKILVPKAIGISPEAVKEVALELKASKEEIEHGWGSLID